MMPEVCNKVAIEPHLQPVTSEEISCASQHPGWCHSTPRMVPLNTQDGTSQDPEWCFSTPRMVPLNTQDGASQHPGWCLSTPGRCLSMPRMVPLPAPRMGQVWMWQQSFWASRFEGAFLTLGFPTHSHLSNQQSQLLSCYLKHENIKNGAYDQRIWEVEQATFTL